MYHRCKQPPLDSYFFFRFSITKSTRFFANLTMPSIDMVAKVTLFLSQFAFWITQQPICYNPNPQQNPTDTGVTVPRLRTIATIIKTMPTIAVVGFSSNSAKAGFYVPQYLQKYGYHIVPVNPHITGGLGETAYAALQDIPFPIDVVQIFRRPEYVDPFIAAAIEIDAQAIWLQRDITSVNGTQLAEQSGLLYVENACMMVEHRHLLQSGWSGTPKKSVLVE